MLQSLFDKDHLSDLEKKRCDAEFLQISNETLIFLNEITLNNDFESIYKLLKVYNLFDFYDIDYSNKFVRFLHLTFLNYYMQHIDKMIKSRNDFAIYSLIDLFYCDRNYFVDVKRNQIFFEHSYPVLLLKTENLSTFIATATLRLISILESEKEVYFFERYLNQDINLIYKEEVERALENIL